MCELCRVIDEIEAITFTGQAFCEGLYWVVIKCRTCYVPMAILKSHSAAVTREELEELMGLWKEYYPKKMLRTQARQIADHIHFHFE